MDSGEINTDLAMQMRKLGVRYSRRDCIKLCQENILSRNFGCHSIKPSTNGSRGSGGAASGCPISLRFLFNLTDCLDSCPHECRAESYDLSTSYSEYPSRVYFDKLRRGVLAPLFSINSSSLSHQQQNDNEELFQLKMARRSLTRVFVYFDEIKYTQITETPTMCFVDLVANVGGTMGLFIGISLLSFVELIELFLETLGIFWMSLRRRNKSRVG